MGSDHHYAEEAPARRVRVDAFEIDRCQVTNSQFTEFVDATGWVTISERPLEPADYPGVASADLGPGSLVFTPTPGPVDLRNINNWWMWTRGASWRHPAGPASDLTALQNHPVVHVAYDDVEAYCNWSGRQLPTEAEWEYAARGGLDGAEFTWGEGDPQETAPVANTWQGRFPWQNTELDGWGRTAPVSSFPPNGYDLFDMAGNVWEWTSDWFTAQPGDMISPCCVPDNPRGGARDASYDPALAEFRIPRKVVKGGSHLCARNYCFRYRPAARQPQMVDTGMSHIGFRTIQR